MNRSQRDGLLLIVISAAGYSFFPIFTKWIYESGLTSPLDILAWRFLIATPLMWAWVVWHRVTSPSSASDRGKLPRLPLILMGVLFAVAVLSAIAAVSLLPVPLYTVLFYAYPAMVAMGSLLFGERLSHYGWLALAVMLVGIVLTVPDLFAGFSAANPQGLLFVFINASGYAVYILLSSRLLRGLNDLVSASAWSITGSLIFVLGAILIRGISFPSGTGWLGLFGLATISTVIPIMTFYAGLRRLGAARAAILSMLEPVLTLLWALLIRGEGLGWLQMIGAGLVLGSVFILQRWGESRRQVIPS